LRIQETKNIIRQERKKNNQLDKKLNPEREKERKKKKNVILKITFFYGCVKKYADSRAMPRLPHR
jgi:hypothetical protein